MQIDDEVLDHPAWESLTNHHKSVAEGHGKAVRFRPDTSPFAALHPSLDEEAWADLTTLVGPGKTAVLIGEAQPQAGWTRLWAGEGLQMVGPGLEPETEPEAVVLGDQDVPDMLGLIERTQPGPFEARTIELGTYLGVRRNGRLVAMAGERMHPPGWVEISAVCTDPDYRGQGLASRLIRALAGGIRDRGETPFLHVAGSNTNAIRLYLAMGFTVRRKVIFHSAQAPGADA